MRVKLYWNLHRKCWSILAKNARGSWTVIAYADYAVLADCTFKVSEAGRQRVIRERRKNVHAFAIGTLVKSAPVPCVWKVRYNPYTAPTFVDVDDRPVHQADYAVFEGRKVCINTVICPDLELPSSW